MASPKPPHVDKDLDDQIALAERAVIARDARIRHRTDVLAHRIKRTALKNAGGGAVLGLATMGLTWWLNRRRPDPAPAAAPEPGHAHTYEHLFRDAAFTLGGLLPILWPMLPRGLRRSVSPGTAGTLLSFLAPLVGRLLRRKPKAPA